MVLTVLYRCCCCCGCCRLYQDEMREIHSNWNPNEMKMEREYIPKYIDTLLLYMRARRNTIHTKKT